MQRRNSPTDRRQRTHHPFFNVHALRGRRRGSRRDDEHTQKDLHSDHYPAHWLIIVILTLILCLADAHNTLLLILRGAEEANLLMDHLIHTNTTLFIAVKMLLTGLGLVVLVGYHRQTLFKLFSMKHVMYGVLAMYALLMGYQAMLWPGESLSFILLAGI